MWEVWKEIGSQINMGHFFAVIIFTVILALVYILSILCVQDESKETHVPFETYQNGDSIIFIVNSSDHRKFTL